MHFCWGLNKPFITPQFSLSPLTQPNFEHIRSTQHISYLHISYGKLNYPQINSCNPSGVNDKVWQVFSFQRLNDFLKSHSCILAQHNMYFILICAQSGLAQVRKKHAWATWYWFPQRQLAGTASSFFWSACNMHKSSVIWVKTKVLWCCNIAP